MKNVMKAVAAMMLMTVVVCVVGCKKDDNSDDGGNNNGSGGGGILNGHEWVDLGLPSGTLWAACNVGATTPEGFGDYFAWGETTQKTTYDWNTYKYCMGNYNTLTKYCSDSSYGYNGFTDTLTMLQVMDDAATVNWGNDWRTPTYDEWIELFENTNMLVMRAITGRILTAFMVLTGNMLGYMLGLTFYTTMTTFVIRIATIVTVASV